MKHFDRRGNRADDDGVFGAATLAREEEQLRALGPAEPLSPEQLDALVAAATTRRTDALARRVLLLAGLFALLLLPLAWIGANVVWPERKQAPLTMTYAEAVDVATNPAYDASGHESAAGMIAQYCGYGVQTLARLRSDDADPSLKETAKSVCAGLAEVLRSNQLDTPTPVEGDFLQTAKVVADPTASVELRAQAVGKLERMMHSGCMALLVARAHVLEEGLPTEKATTWITRLLAELAKVTGSG